MQSPLEHWNSSAVQLTSVRRKVKVENTATLSSLTAVFLVRTVFTILVSVAPSREKYFLNSGSYLIFLPPLSWQTCSVCFTFKCADIASFFFIGLCDIGVRRLERPRCRKVLLTAYLLPFIQSPRTVYLAITLPFYWDTQTTLAPKLFLAAGFDFH